MDAFISYRRKDVYAAHFIREKLMQMYNVDVFLDTYDIYNGDFRQAIQAYIEAAPNFILLLSPNTFERRRADEVDYVREEIRIAYRLKKHFVIVALAGFVDPSDSEWAEEDREISWIRHYERKYFDLSSPDAVTASLNLIVKRMVTDEGRRFTGERRIKATNYYQEVSVTEEDKLWVTTNCEVCREMETNLFRHILATNVYHGRESINLFCLDLYDPKTYRDRFSRISEVSGNGMQVNIYGFCHDYDLEESEQLFGKNHFIVCTADDEFEKNLNVILQRNGLVGFDFIDMTLVLKDLNNPEAALDLMRRYVGPDDGVLFIRELDDEAVYAYPDPCNYIPQLLELLRKNPSAGNRELGRRLSAMFCRLYPRQMYISNEVVSTANHKSTYCLKLCDAYFSYLVPEYRTLSRRNNDLDEYRRPYEWLEDNYDAIRSMFKSPEFYFRSGFVAGYCIVSGNDGDDY